MAKRTSPSTALALKAAKKTKDANPMWGGHYKRPPSAIMTEINASIDFDKKLYKQDIAGSLAHAKMLAAQKIISKKDFQSIEQGLHKIQHEIESGEFIFSSALEDIHMHVEARLKELIGEAAGRLHTARSRNDQVATDSKLYTRDAIDLALEKLKFLQEILLKRAEENINTIMPGFTHLQTAQPISLAHHLLAYVEMFGRDISRFTDARQRLNECPLGACALAGTSFPIDRFKAAAELGFTRPTENSLDSVSDRDFALEFMSAASLFLMHTSRLCEEIVLWVNADFAFAKLSEAFTTGSSIMPQKRNPDAAELVRAKTGRVYGNLFSLLTVMKGLPLAYSKDMQEDKEPLFDTVETLFLCIDALSGMIADIKFAPEKMLIAAKRGFSTATDIADWLVQNINIPFREAHHITGTIVRLAENKKCELAELSLQDLQQIEPRINKKLLPFLAVENSVASRTSYGGVAPKNIAQAIIRARKRFGILPSNAKKKK
jgi:argininosuccinate lyase